MNTIGHIYENPTEIGITNGKIIVCEKGMKLKAIKSCFDNRYLHEKNNYPREGLKELKLEKDDIVTVIGCWKNFYGQYIRCEFEKEIYDITPENLDIK